MWAKSLIVDIVILKNGQNSSPFESVQQNIQTKYPDFHLISIQNIQTKYLNKISRQNI